MKTFDYTIQDAVGIHARPAGLIVKKAKEFESSLTLQKGDKSADLKKLMMLMSLGVKCGDTVTITAEGPDEELASSSMKQFFEETI